MAPQKKVFVYHYYDGIGQQIAFDLGRSNYSAEYIQINRQVSRGTIADDVAVRKPNLVFLSLNFGRNVGIDTRFQEGLEELVKIKERSDIPVVLVTGGGSTFREEAMRRGASGYLEIPYTIDELIRLSERLTSQQSQS